MTRFSSHSPYRSGSNHRFRFGVIVVSAAAIDPVTDSFRPIVNDGFGPTSARTEGYFRLEWRLADHRTHLMGKSHAFLVPVCIDDTPDATADIPDSFAAVQWTRLIRGETPPA
jgi:hypothetical protein